MGTETIPDRAAGQRMKRSWINNFRDVLIGHFVGRGSSGIPRAEYGRLGTSVYRWKEAFVRVGYLGLGDVVPWYDYAGQFTIPQGWMLCNGVVINQSNYDAQHAAGDWAAFIGSTSLSGKYLPDMNDNFPIGETSGLQSGASAITTTGSHTNNLAHTHNVGNSSAPSQVVTTVAAPGVFVPEWSAGSSTHTHSAAAILESLSTAQNIEPEHILCKFLMRIK